MSEQKNQPADNQDVIFIPDASPVEGAPIVAEPVDDDFDILFEDAPISEAPVEEPVSEQVNDVVPEQVIDAVSTDVETPAEIEIQEAPVASPVPVLHARPPANQVVQHHQSRWPLQPLDR